MPPCKIVLRLAALAVACAALPRTADAAGYYVTKLTLPGASQSAVSDLSDTGRVVGYATFAATRTAPAVNRGFLFLPTAPNGTSGPVIDLGTLGGNNCVPRAINTSGQIVGSSDARLPNGSVVSHAFLLTPKDTDGDGRPDTWFRNANGDGRTNALMTELGNSLGWELTSAWGLNDRGQVVGEGSAPGSPNVSYPLLWDRDGTGNLLPAVRLPSFAGGGGVAEINEAGVLVGTSTLTPGGTARHAALWVRSDDGAYTLSSLGTLGGASSVAWGVNAGGQVAGYAQLSSSTYHGFVWADANGNGVRDGGEMADLGTVTGGTGDVMASGINDSGQVVGKATTKAGDRALLWLQNIGGAWVSTDLNTLKTGGETGLSLIVAKKINNAPWPQIAGLGNAKNGPAFAALLTPQ